MSWRAKFRAWRASRWSEGSLRWPLYVSIAVLFYSLVSLLLFYRIRIATGGHVLFTLDDPYIHLALAEQIASGHYGINPAEASSPSSSLLWPYLLAPFAAAKWQPYAALALNGIFGLATAVLLGMCVAQWPGHDGSADETVRRTLSTVALVMTGNLIGLTFVGMEHTLEVMLVVLCGMGLLRAMRGQAVPWWCLAAAVVAPSVRYEAVCVTVAVTLCLAGQRRVWQATSVTILGVAPLIGFGMYLRHRSLPALPLSVLVKGGGIGGHGNLLYRLLILARGGVHLAFTDPAHSVLGILFLTLVGLAVRAPERGRRSALSGGALAAGLHLLVGPFGWFHRYEVYVVLLSALLVLQALFEQPKPRALLGWYSLGLFALCSISITTTEDTVKAAEDVYLQQYQMHRFMTEFADGNVAVNDLGLVSYRRRPGQTVLDLLGLASLESAQQEHKTAEWLDSVTREHSIATVMVYPGWFEAIPADWTQLGVLCGQRQPVTLGGNCVSYFATPQADVLDEQTEFQAFVRTLPTGITVQTDKR